tara:strand:- start:396 stop:632 length:237 start_codon:yes stop_codon:yes gene_type:complete
MTNLLELYPVGTKVLLTEDISAVIITTSIHDGNMVQYECAWWNGKSRTREWFNASEILGVDEDVKPTKIGFLRDGENE